MSGSQLAPNAFVLPRLVRSSLLLVLGCESATPMPVVGGIRTVDTTPPVTELQVVPAQTTFEADLATDIGSAFSRTGDVFRATLVSGLPSATGTVIVDVGATLVGHVVSVRRPPDAAIYLQFDSLETKRGLKPIRVSLMHDQPEPSVRAFPPTAEYDAALQSRPGIPLYGPAVGGAPVSEETPRQEPRPSWSDVRLVKGARLRFYLTEPFETTTLKM
ncbi:MAG TPA: hypothetical protein VJT73_04905 [Polyangiaceae bacterium]|nr:hypothetical protein [Polyangiaceae bacterium]